MRNIYQAPSSNPSSLNGTTGAGSSSSANYCRTPPLTPKNDQYPPGQKASSLVGQPHSATRYNPNQSGQFAGADANARFKALDRSASSNAASPLSLAHQQPQFQSQNTISPFTVGQPKQRQPQSLTIQPGMSSSPSIASPGGILQQQNQNSLNHYLQQQSFNKRNKSSSSTSSSASSALLNNSTSSNSSSSCYQTYQTVLNEDDAAADAQGPHGSSMPHGKNPSPLSNKSSNLDSTIVSLAGGSSYSGQEPKAFTSNSGQAILNIKVTQTPPSSNSSYNQVSRSTHNVNSMVISTAANSLYNLADSGTYSSLVPSKASHTGNTSVNDILHATPTIDRAKSMIIDLKDDRVDMEMMRKHENASARQANDDEGEEQETEKRFFESNTLYKRELKQKQRDIISTSSSSLSFMVSGYRADANANTSGLSLANQQSEFCEDKSNSSPIMASQGAAQNESPSSATRAGVHIPILVRQTAPASSSHSPMPSPSSNSVSTTKSSASSSVASSSFSLRQKSTVSVTPPSDHVQSKSSSHSQPHHSHSNKVLSLFSHLINRNRSNSSNTSQMNMTVSNTNNYVENGANSQQAVKNNSSSSNGARMDGGHSKGSFNSSSGDLSVLKQLKRAVSTTSTSSSSKNHSLPSPMPHGSSSFPAEMSQSVMTDLASSSNSSSSSNRPRGTEPPPPPTSLYNKSSNESARSGKSLKSILTNGGEGHKFRRSIDNSTLREVTQNTARLFSGNSKQKSKTKTCSPAKVSDLGDSMAPVRPVSCVKTETSPIASTSNPNVVYSTKNNGLIFLPSPTKSRTPSNDSNNSSDSASSSSLSGGGGGLIENSSKNPAEQYKAVVNTLGSNHLNDHREYQLYSSQQQQPYAESCSSSSNSHRELIVNFNNCNDNYASVPPLNAATVITNENNESLCISSVQYDQIMNGALNADVTSLMDHGKMPEQGHHHQPPHRAASKLSSSSSTSSSSSSSSSYLSFNQQLASPVKNKPLFESSSSNLLNDCQKQLQSGPSDEEPKGKNENAFDNVVYSYVDNIRQHSKRLSESNLLSPQANAMAAAVTAAAAAVNANSKNSSPTYQNKPHSNDVSLSISTSLHHHQNPSSPTSVNTSVHNQQLNGSQPEVRLVSSSSSSNLAENPAQPASNVFYHNHHQHKSFDNRVYMKNSPTSAAASNAAPTQKSHSMNNHQCSLNRRAPVQWPLSSQNSIKLNNSGNLQSNSGRSLNSPSLLISSSSSSASSTSSSSSIQNSLNGHQQHHSSEISLASPKSSVCSQSPSPSPSLSSSDTVVVHGNLNNKPINHPVVNINRNAYITKASSSNSINHTQPQHQAALNAGQSQNTPKNLVMSLRDKFEQQKQLQQQQQQQNGGAGIVHQNVHHSNSTFAVNRAHIQPSASLNSKSMTNRFSACLHSPNSSSVDQNLNMSNTTTTSSNVLDISDECASLTNKSYSMDLSNLNENEVTIINSNCRHGFERDEKHEEIYENASHLKYGLVDTTNVSSDSLVISTITTNPSVLSTATSASSGFSTPSSEHLGDGTINREEHQVNSSVHTENVLVCHEQPAETAPAIKFQFFYEFYNLMQKQPRYVDSRAIMNESRSAAFYGVFKEHVNCFLKEFFTSPSACLSVRYVLDPPMTSLLDHAESAESRDQDDSSLMELINFNDVDALESSQLFASMFNYKFTICFSKSLLKNKLFATIHEENALPGRDIDDASHHLDVSQLAKDEDGHGLDEGGLAEQLAGLVDDANTSTIIKVLQNSVALLVPDEEGDKFKRRTTWIKCLLARKLRYLKAKLEHAVEETELNNKLGMKILGLLEKEASATAFELDKYKLLVNESDVINNLLIKLDNKLSNMQNSMQIMQLKQIQLKSSPSANRDECAVKSPITGSSSLNEEIDLLRQEINQIKRKREEAMFLKNGIDKRAAIVSDFLKNYLSEDELREFEMFMNMKSVCALKQRHIKDHMELTHLQMKLVDDLVLASGRSRTKEMTSSGDGPVDN